MQHASAQIQRGEAITATGASAIGNVSVGQTGSVYWLRFDGDEQIEYQIDTSTPEVREGILRIYEKSSDSYPLHYGGVNFRDASGATHSAYWLRNYAHLDSVTTGQDTVTLDFTDDLSAYGWGVHHRRHTLQLQGKTLRLRIEDLDKNAQFKPNYSGVFLGPTVGTENASFVEMQGGLLSPIILFRDAGESWFLSHMIDMYNTNSASYAIHQMPIAGSEVTYNLWTNGLYKPSTGSLMSGYLDDTYNITVSSKVKDVLVTPTQPGSPYRELLTGRTMINLPATNWPVYAQFWNLLGSWGIDDVAGYFFDWSAPLPGSSWSQGPGPSWSPAKDPGNFANTVQQGRAKGYLLGGYMAFNIMPPFAPPGIYDPSHIARDENSAMKLDYHYGYPLITQTAAGIHARREALLFRNNYGGNMAYLDIQSYASPIGGSDGDHIDQVLGSGWSRTLGKGVHDQKQWMLDMQDTFEGPLVGEGSISANGSNLEWLWAGYVDSVQRCINTGVGTDACNVPAGSPLAPTNWPVIPEYEWRVFSRLQANHGNGFASRFFGPSDGPSMVLPSGQPILPMTEPALDRYRLYEITYGKTAFVSTNGPFDGGDANYIRHADVIKEHYMMNALQTLYYASRLRSIQYLHNGALKNFEPVLFETGSTAAFKDPRIKISFANGLEMYLNHNPSAWNVTVAGVNYTIPEDGYVAMQPGTGFIAFSAIPAGLGSRIDYCYAPNRYEVFDGRGAVDSWGGISTGGVKRLKFVNFVHNITGTESSSGSIQTSNGTPPACVSVKVLPGNVSVKKGTRQAFKAIATFSNGAIRNVTSLVDWSTADQAVARVNEGAALKANGFGSTSVSITSFQGAPVTPATVHVY